MDEIETEIKKIVPSLDEEAVTSLIQRLVELGVREKSHLELVEEHDLTDILQTIPARLLIRSWKNKYKVADPVIDSEVNEVLIKKEVDDTHKPNSPKNKVTDPVICNGEDKELRNKVVVCNTHKHVQSNLDWAFSFKIAWDRMPKDVMKSLIENKRLGPGLRRKLVRLVTDDIFEICEKPGRKALAIIAKKMVKEYSASLADFKCGKIVGEGHTSLLTQLDCRFHNLNRLSPYSIMKRTLEHETVGQKRKRLRVSDCCCVNLQPSGLPMHETEETQQSKKVALLEMSSNKKNLNMLLVCKLLEDTYYTIRKDINAKKSVIDLKIEWPLLFTKEGIFQHFNILMDIDIMEKMSDTLFRKGIKLLKFLKILPCMKKQEKKMQQFLNSLSSTHEDHPDLSTLITLLMMYFNEDIHKLFFSGVTTTADERENIDLPNTPCLICYGVDVTKANSYMLCIDGTVVLEDIHNFLEGFTLMFSSYYCFNINYPKSAAATLEFVQRCFLGINPNCGSKADTKRENINSKILSIMNKFSEFELAF